ncbi:MAG: L,D-transpeptidase [Acidimicrobiia bacterium]|nr:L,D-transpeptidase [Acidimicrobiia bacterium]
MPVRPSPRRPFVSILHRSIVAVVASLALVGLLGSCAGERPSLGKQAPVTTAAKGSTTSTSSSAPPATVPAPVVPGPDTLLGYIATPTAKPVVRAEPRDDAPAIDIPAVTALGAPTTLAVLGDATTAAGGGWYQVVLPTRPNGATGWVPAASVTITKTPFRLFIDLEGRALRVEKDGTAVMNSKIAIGTSENPTPVGASYLTELIDNVEPGGAYGPYAFGLALHSDTLTEFAGGPGQVGIHGTNKPELIGDRVSSGCIRLTNDGVGQLVDFQLPLGAPVLIT